MRKLRTKVRLLVLLALVLGTTACNIDGNFEQGPLETENKTVKLGVAKSANVEIQMGAGELNLGGGAKDLMEAEFTYNVPRWKPEVQYNVSGTTGQLTVRQHAHTGGPRGARKNQWDLRLNNSVPMDLRVELGAGKSNLVLGSLSLENLQVHMGVGEAVVDLGGDWKNNLRANIEGGVGKATVRLPRDVGVEVHATGGIGEIHAAEFRKQGNTYVNESFGKSPITLRIDVSGGVGEIDLQLASGPPVV